jgi:hypothetical protein
MSIQLKYGLDAEIEFCHRYPKKLLRVEGHRKWDFDCTDGYAYELKTDTYSMHKSQNFFMERWSVLDKKKPGGPWQALENGADIFIYCFINNKTYFEFKDLPALVDRLDLLTEKQGLVYIPNKGWTTAGYKVKRDSLKDLCEEWHW